MTARVHDMGGRFGDGPVVPEPEGHPFHADWHARALAVTLACGSLGKWNIDISRHARERLAPMDYARFGYYDKWMSALADMLVETGVLSVDELARGQGDGQAAGTSDLTAKKLAAGAVQAVLKAGGPADRPSDVAPAFTIGQSVRTRRIPHNAFVDGGHTRLPRYAAGAVGRVERLHGCHVLPDASAHRLGDQAEPLYAVVFAASELWAQPEHPRDQVVLDLWQSYLEPVE